MACQFGKPAERGKAVLRSTGGRYAGWAGPEFRRHESDSRVVLVRGHQRGGFRAADGGHAVDGGQPQSHGKVYLAAALAALGMDRNRGNAGGIDRAFCDVGTVGTKAEGLTQRAPITEGRVRSL